MTDQSSDLGNKSISAFGSRKLWLSLTAGIALAVVLISQISLEDLAKGLAQVSFTLFIAAIPCRLASNLVRTARFAYFFPGDGMSFRMFGAIALSEVSNYVVPFRIAVGGKLLRLFGTFALIRVTNYVVPFRLGEVVSVYLLKKLGFTASVAETAPIWIFFRLCDFIALALIASSAFLVFTIPTGIETHLGIGVIAILAGFGVVVGVTPLIVRTIDSRQWLQNSAWIGSKYASIKDGMAKIRSFKAFAISLICAVLIWTFNIAGSVFALLAFGAPLTIGECILASILVTFTGLLPIRPPLGLGVTDVVWVAVLSLLGVPFDQAVVLSIGTRLAVMAAVLIDAVLSATILLPTTVIRGKRDAVETL